MVDNGTLRNYHMGSIFLPVTEMHENETCTAGGKPIYVSYFTCR